MKKKVAPAAPGRGKGEAVSKAAAKENELPEPLVYEEPEDKSLLVPKGALIKVNGVTVRTQAKVWVQGKPDEVDLIGPASALVVVNDNDEG